MLGKVNSIQTLATLDGPGIRYAVFLAGCNLRCGCCHNPDTWTQEGAKEYEAEYLVKSALRYREYFGELGGITLSGGEPLLQAKFACEVFTRAKSFGINTCLDTSGSVINDEVKMLLSATDRVLLDIKYTNQEDYERFVGCSLFSVISFLDLLEDMRVKTTVRQVIIPTLNDSEENIRALHSITKSYSVIDGLELLPFRKMCRVKYENLGIPFPFDKFSEPKGEKIEELTRYFHSL